MMRRFSSRLSSLSAFHSPVVSVPSRFLSYTPNKKDVLFLFDECLNIYGHWNALAEKSGNADLKGCSELFPTLVDECAKVAQNAWFPSYQLSDTKGASYNPTTQDVSVTPGYKEAWEAYKDGGWFGLSFPTEYGGQFMPLTVARMVSQFVAEGNWPLALWPLLSSGAAHVLELFAPKWMQEQYLPRMVSGEWSGTMCLTEPHCGTDLAQLSTKAEPLGDGRYKINGTKIFISCGEHNLNSNIVHITIARIVGAPKGVKGISLFMVPKYLNPEEPNPKKNVICSGIEHKMGIHGCCTCTMQFEDSIGWLMGKENDGLAHMFVMMNHARLGIAVQGVASAELSLQNAAAYARERLSGRSLEGPKEPKKVADPIINHPDIRRMLFLQKIVADGGRYMLYYSAMLQDQAQYLKGQESVDADNRLGFVTPIVKGFFTELGKEAADQGIQVLGGHGYISDHGLEQIYRDSRIGTLYEGTTGVQANDLIGRKTLSNGLKLWTSFKNEMVAKANEIKPFSLEIAPFVDQWVEGIIEYDNALNQIAQLAKTLKPTTNCVADDNLYAAGYLFQAMAWCHMAAVASKFLAENPDHADATFYLGKVQTCKYYFSKIWPRFHSHVTSMLNPQEPMIAVNNDIF